MWELINVKSVHMFSLDLLGQWERSSCKASGAPKNIGNMQNESADYMRPH
jgi:hypothetical protein